MILEMDIENFKAFGVKQKFNLSKINLIYGKNSGGKSSIIQSILMLKQSHEAAINKDIRNRFLIPKGDYVDLGQSKSMHFKHIEDNNISIGIKTKTSFLGGSISFKY